MAAAAFDHSGANALNLSSRRLHMEAFFKHLGIWNSSKVAETREKCVEKYCEFLDERGYTTINQEYFEYQVDSLVWHNFLKRKKVLTKANEWPWSDTVPTKDDATAPVSVKYRDWLRRKSDAKGKGKALVHQDPAAPVTGESSKAAQGIRSAAAGASKPSAAAPDQDHATWRTRKSAKGKKVALQKPADEKAPENTAPPAASLAAVHAVTQQIKEIQLDSAEKREADQKKAEEAAARQQTARKFFDAELARIEALKHDAPDEKGLDWVEGEQAIWPDPYIDPKDSLPVREDWGVHNWDKVDACPLPDKDLCEMLWWRTVNKPRPDPITGPFEMALPDWLDFHDLVLHDFQRIAMNKLIDSDIAICWRVKGGYPVSLVVGPAPSMDHDGDDMSLGMRVRSTWMKVATWLGNAYSGSPGRLADYLHNRMWWVVRKGEWEDLKAVPHLIDTWERITSDPDTAIANARMNRDNMDKWVPEIHAILTQPRVEVPLLLKTWVDREGSQHVYARKTLARDTWAQVSMDDGLSWFEGITAAECEN
ncbi:uncharacterized protein FFB20_14877 [Fusarium fujikuroi]|nr:uncharacterized protein FFB20_14877 [Fusarium fujikuroi]SCO20690.1 uncharacterized protein FFC1_13806 [Fusarium fujikuroi]SCO45500.1 uncharacterized protein FFNC_10326 [Fusarium fujikuroi]VTT83133.1 unnamed protein product [Fusarium fujikuroi]